MIRAFLSKLLKKPIVDEGHDSWLKPGALYEELLATAEDKVRMWDDKGGVIPNHYVIHISKDDFELFYHEYIQETRRRAEDAIREYAREAERFVLKEPVRIDITCHKDLALGEIRVYASFDAGNEAATAVPLPGSFTPPVNHADVCSEARTHGHSAKVTENGVTTLTDDPIPSGSEHPSRLQHPAGEKPLAGVVKHLERRQWQSEPVRTMPSHKPFVTRMPLDKIRYHEDDRPLPMSDSDHTPNFIPTHYDTSTDTPDNSDTPTKVDMFCLIDTETGKAFIIDRPDSIIGRKGKGDKTKQADVIIDDARHEGRYRYLSKRHVRIFNDDDAWVISEESQTGTIGSTNGTTVERGCKTDIIHGHKQVILEENDIIHLADKSFRFERVCQGKTVPLLCPE